MDDQKKRRSMLIYIIVAFVVYLLVSQAIAPQIRNATGVPVIQNKKGELNI